MKKKSMVGIIAVVILIVGFIPASNESSGCGDLTNAARVNTITSFGCIALCCAASLMLRSLLRGF